MASDRNLLVGILALQNDFITRDQLVEAMNAWVLAKHRPLADILRERGTLEDEERVLLEALVNRQLAKHAGDVAKSLQGLSMVPTLHAALAGVGDDAVQASMAFLSTPAAGLATAAYVLTPPADGLRYRVLRPHARGGLGEVFVAEDTELHREVALKEMQARLAHDQASRGRFLFEAETTGRLEHPGIVPVYGLGVYPDGRPFYAMRFIRGDTLQRAIDRFHAGHVGGFQADRVAVGVEFRRLLGRFIDVCNAVAYAHSQGVIHRDLKPANVMLGEFGETLLVDWGLAKKLQADRAAVDGQAITRSDASSHATHHGAALGTPTFMAPEQAEGKLHDLGPATDVYGLGAMLYVLLTGRPPVPTGEVADILEKVRHGEAGFHSPEPEAQARATPAPLRALCMKAMSLRPGDRYESAQALAADVEHWLADEPVSCHDEPWTVRVGRLARKHRTLVTSAAAVLLVATLGSIIALAIVGGLNQRLDVANQQLDMANVQLRQRNDALERSVASEKAERARAVEAEADTKAFSDFLVDHVLAASRPEGVQAGIGVDVKMSQALEAAEKRIAAVFNDRPKAEAVARHAIGVTWRNLGKYKEAEDHLRRAVDLRRHYLGETDQDTLNSMNSLGVVLAALGKFDLAITLQERTLAAFEARLGIDHPHTLIASGNLATAYRAAGKLDQALPLLERGVKGFEDKLGDDHPDTLTARNNLAVAYGAAGRLDLAIPLFERTLKLREAKLGPDHPNTLVSGCNLAGAYRTAGKLDLAIPLFERVLPSLEAKLGDNHLETLAHRNDLAIAYQNAGALDRALPIFERTFELREARLGADHLATRISRQNLVDAYLAMGKFDEAIRVYERTLMALEAKLGSDHPDTINATSQLAAAYLNGRPPAEGATLIDKFVAGERTRLAAKSAQMARVLTQMATALSKAEQFAAAAKHLREALAIRQKHQSDSWSPFYNQSMLGEALMGRVRSASKDEPVSDILREAEQQLLQGYEGLKQRADNIPPEARNQRLREAIERLVQLYDVLAKPDEAARWRKELEVLKTKDTKP